MPRLALLMAVVLKFPADGAAGGAEPSSEYASAGHWRDEMTCGVGCCYVLLRMNGRNLRYDEVRKQVRVTPNGSTFADLLAACEHFGLDVRAVRSRPSDLTAVSWPAIAHVLPHAEADNGGRHFVVVVADDGQYFSYIDPSEIGVRRVARGEFLRAWSGYLIVTPPRIGSEAVTRNRFLAAIRSGVLGSLELSPAESCSGVACDRGGPQRAPLPGWLWQLVWAS